MVVWGPSLDKHHMDLTDGHLLKRFAAHGEVAAFEALVRRYSTLVLGVCRRTLHKPNEAETAFQATFMALARSAGKLPSDRPLGNWLYEKAISKSVRLGKHPFKTRASSVVSAPDDLVDSTVKAAQLMVKSSAVTLLLLGISDFFQDTLGTVLHYKPAVLVSSLALLGLGAFLTLSHYGLINFKGKGTPKGVLPIDRDYSSQSTPLNGSSYSAKSARRMRDYMASFQSAVGQESNPSRWAALRSMGFDLSEAEFLRVEQDSLESFARELQVELPSTELTEENLLAKYKATNGNDWKVTHWSNIKSRSYHASIFRQWVATHPGAAAECAYRLQLLPEDDDNDLFTFGGGVVLSSQNLEAEINSPNIASTTQAGFFKRVMAQWSMTDSRAAMAWAEKLPEGRGRDVALAGIMLNPNAN